MDLTKNTDQTSPALPSNSELSKEDIIDLLADEDEQVEKPAPKKEEKVEEKEDEEEKLELSDEEKEDEEEEPTEELTNIPFKKKQILKDYPDIFKKYPYLETAYYRDQQFTEVVSTPEEARELVEKVESLEKLQNTVVTGDMESVLKTIKEANSDSFGKIVDDYLSVLNKVDPNAFNVVLGNIVKDTVAAMFEEAQNIDSEELKQAAIILNQFVFRTSKFAPPTKYRKEEPKVSEAEERVKQKERELVERQFKSANEDLNTRVNNVLKATIDRYIDPKNSLTPYEKKNAIRDALEQLQSTIDGDTVFSRTLDNLWKRAFQTNFDKRSLDNIRTAYLSKAKTHLLETIKKVRNEALRDKRTTPTDKSKRGPLPPNRTSTSSPNRGKSGGEEKSTIPRGMSTLDFLNSED